MRSRALDTWMTNERGSSLIPNTGIRIPLKIHCAIGHAETSDFKDQLTETRVSAPPAIGIRSFGAYIPRRRMPRAVIAAAHAWALPNLNALAKGERSLCSWDEDVITMAVEAGRDCLRAAATNEVTALTLASTTAPYADLQNATLVGAALKMSADAAMIDTGGSTRAGLSAVIEACQSSRRGNRLVIASDHRQAKPGSVQELQYGSGAGAVLIGDGTDLIAAFLGAETVSVPFFDHFRKTNEKFDYYWEERWIRDEGLGKIVPSAVKALLGKVGRTIAQVAWFGMTGGTAGSDKLVAKLISIPAERLVPDLQPEVGDTGAAHGILALIAALERAKAGDLVLIVSFAQGCQVVAFEMLQPVHASVRRGLRGSISRRIEESVYMKMLSFSGEVQLDWGMRAETDNKSALTQLYRSADQIFGFVGGRCESCHAVQFPRLPSCVDCGATDSQKPYSLADEPAKVATYTADWLQYSPAPPLYIGLVQFDVGARVLMEMVDVGPEGIDIGTPLEMIFRIKERDQLRHYDRYFWKATPA
jgi:3-hydroxy-3-methylglutaryl CoA synthase